MSTVSEGEAATDHAVKTYPLNSRHLMAETVSRIAKGLGLPTNALQAEMRQLIKGRLGEKHKPKNIQVDVVKLRPEITVIRLQDEEGVFIKTLEEERTGEEQQPDRGREGLRSQSASPSEGEAGRVPHESTEREAELTRQLESAWEHECELEQELMRRQRNHEQLTEEVRVLNDKVKEGREKYAALWHINCEQLSEYDEGIAPKDEENQALRARVESMESPSEHELPPRESHTREGSTPSVDGRHAGRA